MKKMIMSYLIAVLLCFSLAGCGSNDVTEQKENVMQPEEENIEEAAEKGDTEEDDIEEAEENQSVENDTDEYALLQEFIDLICSYSDPPEAEGEELENYFKEQYDSWKAGDGYEMIILDDTGHLKMDDHSAEFVGEWWDTYSQRCAMTIECNNGVYYYIDINWGSSAWDNTHWSFTGTYDRNRNGIVYSGSQIQEYYSDNGNVQETLIYTDGEGLLFIGDDGMMYWEDYKENAGDECVFERADY